MDQKKTALILTIAVAIIATGGILWYVQKETKKNEEINAPVDQVVEIDADDNELSQDNTQEGSADILYNEDGSIDTSNWHKCPIGGGTIVFLCPPNWRVSETIITNAPQGQSPLFKEIDTGLITAGMSGAGVDKLLDEDWAEAIENSAKYIEKENTCERLVDDEYNKLLKCYFVEEYHSGFGYYKIERNKNYKKEIYDKSYLGVSYSDLETYNENIQIIQNIIENVLVDNKKFMPSM